MKVTVKVTVKKTVKKTFLSARFFFFYGVIQLFGIMALEFPILLLLYGAVTFVVFLLVLRDRHSLVEENEFGITARLPHQPHLGSQTVLTVQLRPQSKRVQNLRSLTLLVPPLPLLTFANPGAELFRKDLQTELIEHDFAAQVYRLGFHEIKTWPLTVESALGFWRRSLSVPIETCEFRVVPEQKEISEQAFMELLSTQKLLLQGARIHTRGRSPDQFYSVRKYQFPDSIKHIDQKKTAKYGQLMTRLFDTYFSHHLILALDMGRAMCGDVAGSSRHDFYLSACLQLASNAVKSRDQVSLFSFSQKTHFVVAKSKSLVPFQALYRDDPAFRPREEESNFQLAMKNIETLAGQRSLVFIFTDLTKPSVQAALLESLGKICRKHLTVIVSLNDKDHQISERIMAFTPSEHDLKEFKSEYSEFIYDYWLDEKLKLFQRKFAALGGGSVSIAHDNWMTAVERLYTLLRHSTYV